VRTACLVAAVAADEEFGIAGGAGGGRRKALRMRLGARPAWVGGLLVAAALESHFRSLDGVAPLPGDALLLSVNGAGAECGRRCTHAKGCRDSACRLATATEGQLPDPALVLLRLNEMRRRAGLDVAA
jgi:hypothetical protein